MPLPDAPSQSPRVYKLLQNTTLANLTNDDLSSVGDPINLEMLNEDELRRLVVVQLPRLTVKQEWDGLLG